MRRLVAQIALPLALCLSAIAAPAAQAAAPTIGTPTVSHVSTESARLEARISPKGKTTSYHFEYGLADCSSNPCTLTPVPDAKVSGALESASVSANLEGLTPATTYHFRVVAQNNEGADQTLDRTFHTASAPYPPEQIFGPCPNDAYRTEHPSAKLPDCRAYEQASPVDKNGLDVMGMASYLKASPEGDRVSFLTTNGVPGGEGAQELPPYLASRGASGWSTQGLLPPATLGSEARLRGWTPDFSQVFDLVQRFGVSGDAFLARSSADGSLTTIAPFGGGLDRPSYVGSSADGSEVFFETNSELSGTEVYLWDQDSGEVTLASAFNDETAPPQGAVAGPYDLRFGEPAKDGGSRRNYYTQDNHAIASDGSLYFTAEGTGQLYLRRNPGKAQSPTEGDKCLDPALACTIHVSESRRSAPDPFGPRAAAFMTATPDGSKAYFTSGEELTEDAHTGPEADPPAIVRSDLEGKSIKADFLPTAAEGIAIHAGYIYWANPVKGTIGREKLGPSGPEGPEEPDYIVPGETKAITQKFKEPGVFHFAPSTPRYVAVDDEYVYWTNTGPLGEGEFSSEDILPGAGTIGRAKIGLTKAEEIKPEFITGANNPQGIDVNSEFIYWANAGTGFTGEGTIGRAELEGEDVKQSFIQGKGTESPLSVVVDASHIYWAVYEPNGNGNTLVRTDLDGSNVKFHFLGVGVDVRGVALDSEYVYWVSEGKEAIGRMPIADFTQEGTCDSANPPTVPSCEPEFVKTGGRPRGVTVDAEHLYWSVNGETLPHPGKDLYRYDAETEELTDLTSDPLAENGAEVQGVLGASEDGSYLYFAANGDLDGAGQASGGDCKFKELGAGGIVTSGSCSLYLLHGGQSRFIARLDAEGFDIVSDATNWIPLGRGGATLDQTEKTARVSADGHILIFRSQAKLSDYDNEGVPMLYRYDADQDRILCLSCDPTGAPPSGIGPRDARVPAIEPVEVAHVLSRIASPDGDRVFFQSTDPLVQEDVNSSGGCPIVGSSKQAFPSCQDVYEWEAKGTGSCESEAQNGGCLYLLSNGKESSPSFFVDASASGNDAFLLTRARLVRQDQDQLFDLYDARVDGGFASQNEVPKIPCEAEACKPAASAQSQSQSPGSASFSGPGNPPGKTKPRCPKKRGKASASKTKAKSRCGAKHHKRHKRGANAKGRTSR